MADENKTFDEYINNLRQICIEQRKLLGLSQKKVCELLEILRIVQNAEDNGFQSATPLELINIFANQ